MSCDTENLAAANPVLVSNRHAGRTPVVPTGRATGPGTSSAFCTAFITASAPATFRETSPCSTTDSIVALTQGDVSPLRVRRTANSANAFPCARPGWELSLFKMNLLRSQNQIWRNSLPPNFMR